MTREPGLCILRRRWLGYTSGGFLRHFPKLRDAVLDFWNPLSCRLWGHDESQIRLLRKGLIKKACCPHCCKELAA